MAAATWRAAEFLLRLNFDRYEARIREQYVYLEAPCTLGAIGKVSVSTADEEAWTRPEEALGAPAGRRRLLARVFEHPARPTELLQSTGTLTRGTLGVIVLVHGLSPSGIRDKRMESVARAFACLGFTAVVPDYVEFRECSMTLRTLDVIAWSVVAIAQAFRQESVSLFAACVAAGYTLCAVLQNGERVRRRVRAVLCIGSYANVEEMVWCTMLNENADAYGRNAIFYNFLQYSSLLSGHNDEDATDDRPAWLPQLQHALRLALEDSHFLRENTEMAALPKYFQQLCEAERKTHDPGRGLNSNFDGKRPHLVQELYEQLQRDSEFRKLHTIAMLSHPVVQEIVKSCEAIEAVSRQPIDFLIVLVHGEQDDIVPCRESRRLYCAMLHNEQCRVQPLCEVTSLLNHGDRQRLNWWTDMPKIVRLVRVFAQFFAHAVRPRQAATAASVARSAPTLNETRSDWRTSTSRSIRSK